MGDMLMIRREGTSIRDFAFLFTGQTISQLGTNMTSFALIVWAYTKSSQVMASSLLAVCSTVPYLIVSLIGGAVVDNANKKKNYADLRFRRCRMFHYHFRLFSKWQFGTLDSMCGEYDQWLHECFSKSGITGSGNFAG